MTLDFSNILLIILSVIAFIVTIRAAKNDVRNSNLTLPPKFSYLLNLFKGDYAFKEKGPIKLITEGYKKCGEIFRFQVLHRNVTFLIGPEASKLLFSSTDSELSMKKIYGFMTPVFGDGIVYDASPEVMAQQTKFILFGLGKKYFDMYCDKILAETLDYVKDFPADSVREVHRDMLELVSFTASRSLLGDEVREAFTTRAGHLLKVLSDGITQISIFFPRFPCEAHRKRDQARLEIVNIILGIIKRRRKTGDTKHDYLQHIMDSKYRDGSSPTDEHVAGLILATLFGGQHTSSNILTYTISMIAKHRDRYLDRLLAEQRAVFADSKAFTNEKLEKMETLNAFLNEILRLFPPLVILARQVMKPLRYKDYYIPKGDILAVSPSVSHKLPHVYKNPELFDIDRFMPPRNEGEEKFTQQPFGGGKHICPGRHFAFIQMKIIVSVYLQMFDFELVDKNWEPKIDYSHVIAGPYDNNFVRFKRRPVSSILFESPPTNK